MEFYIENLTDAVTAMGGAFLLGGLIGIERQWRQRMAGLRTNTLVALGASIFVVFAGLFPGETSPTRVAAQIVSGVGFLGAGIIFKDGLNVRGLNTAATLWCSAAVGTLCGAGFFIHAAIATAFVITVNGLIRPLVRVLGRQPLIQDESDNAYEIRIVCHDDAEAHVRTLLLRDLGKKLHIRELESTNIEDTDQVEVSAAIHADDRQDRLLERIIGRLSLEPRVTSARWRVVGD